MFSTVKNEKKYHIRIQNTGVYPIPSGVDFREWWDTKKVTLTGAIDVLYVLPKKFNTPKLGKVLTVDLHHKDGDVHGFS